MKIAIIGSGGREHAICEKIYESKKVAEIFCIPGNGGTDKISKNIDINIKNFEEIKTFLLKEKIDMVVIGPEEPLVNGIVDYLNKNKIKVFGPDQFCSQLEGSKIFTKKICKSENIPTAEFKIFDNKEAAFGYINNKNFPVVVKADGLAGGKGVYICNNVLEAKEAIVEIFDGKFGIAKELLVEDFLEGEEMSFFILYDNTSYKIFNTAQDHKRVFEGDMGKNTGGMGAYTPSRLNEKILQEKIINKIILPTLNYLKINGGKYIGFLYAGLMIKNDEPFLIEYNVRMGDPECQTILPLLNNDFVEILENCIKGNLNKIQLDWKDKKSICIVLTSKGYPENYKKNILIEDLEKIKLDKDCYLFHAGTKFNNNKFYSSGGRVLNFVCLDNDLNLARKKCLNLIQKLNWKYGHHRNDIGFKVIQNS